MRVGWQEGAAQHQKAARPGLSASGIIGSMARTGWLRADHFRCAHSAAGSPKADRQTTPKGQGAPRRPKPAPNPPCRNPRRPNRPRAIANLADGRLSGSRLRRSLSGGGGNLPLRCSGKPQAFTNLSNGAPSASRPTLLTFRPRQQPATPAFRQTSGLRQTHQQTVFGRKVLTLVSPVHLRRAMACCCHGHPSGLGDISGNR